MNKYASSVVALLVVGMAAGSSPAGPDEPLVAAARSRMERTRTVRIEFRLEQFDAKGTANKLLGPGSRVKGTVPPEDTKFESANMLLLDGDRTRLEYNHPFWNLSDGALARKPRVVVSKDGVKQTLYPEGMAQAGLKQGSIEKNVRISELASWPLMGLSINLRGMDPNLSPVLLSDFKPTGVVATVGGRKCAEYAAAITANLRFVLWADPQADYLIKRVRSLRGGIVDQQVDVEFQQDPKLGWLPKTWTSNQYGRAGETLGFTAGAVTSIRADVQPSSNDFEVSFPAGTMVADGRIGKEFVVLPDGGMQQVLRDGTLAPLTVAQPDASRPWLRTSIWIAAAVTLLAGGVAAVLYRRRKRPEGQATSE